MSEHLEVKYLHVDEEYDEQGQYDYAAVEEAVRGLKEEAVDSDLFDRPLDNNEEISESETRDSKADEFIEFTEVCMADGSIAYYCTLCNETVSSIEEHIPVHNGQEVEFDVNDLIEEIHESDVLEEVKLEMSEEHNNAYEYIPEKETPEGDIVGCFLCDICDEPFVSRNELRTHRKHHDTKIQLPENGSKKQRQSKQRTEKAFICQICKTEFPTNKSLLLHAKMHDPVRSVTMKEITALDGSGPVEMFHCDVCDKVLYESFRDIHMKSHSGRETFICKVCNRCFPNKKLLDFHQIAHNGKDLIKNNYKYTDDRHFECKFCGKAFKRPHEKVKHERIHTGEKPFSCEICGKCFRVSYCLSLHMRTHSEARPYVCIHCSKSFKSHSVYQHHLKTHSDERPYQCQNCPKSFKTLVQLAGHKNSHTKPFKCTECGRSFASLFAVRNHMELHSESNTNLKHTCSLCKATYARGFALKDHMNHEHADLNGDEELEESILELPDLQEVDSNIMYDISPL